METQFSLSVELSKVVPLVPLINVTSKPLLNLVRAHQRSGSDLATEHDFAKLFGRTSIEPSFGSTFRNPVKTSKIHKLAGALELVLEAGAGPTTQHAVAVAPFFSMVVQLSSLLWAYEIRSLSQELNRLMLAEYSDKSQNVPTFGNILATLRSVREQTSGFLWELEYKAVEIILTETLGLLPTIDLRTLPPIFFATLDVLPALQRSCEDYQANIRTREGLSTVVIWAHKVLDLSSQVLSDGKSITFGAKVHE
jgi:hypothetical protein